MTSLGAAQLVASVHAALEVSVCPFPMPAWHGRLTLSQS